MRWAEVQVPNQLLKRVVDAVLEFKYLLLEEVYQQGVRKRVLKIATYETADEA